MDEDTILDSMLAEVPDDIDKREGSIIYDALAPIAFELAEFYSSLSIFGDEIFADTASYYFLAKRCAERGIYPEDETQAVIKMVVDPVDAKITIGDVFALDDLTYTVTSVIDQSKGEYKVTCDTAGTIGNQQLGALLPSDTGNALNDLKSATLTEVLVPGQDEEDEESLRARYFESFQTSSFGGNKKDYRDNVNAVEGIGACRVIRRWQEGYDPSSLKTTDAVDTWYVSQSASTLGDDVYAWLSKIYSASKNNLLTTGGTIEIIIVTSEYKSPSTELVKTVQNYIDPDESGEGEGLAPIGHVVKITGAEDYKLNYVITLTYTYGNSWNTVKEGVCDAIDQYHNELREKFGESDTTTVRSAEVLVKLLAVTGIADVTDIKINGKTVINLETRYLPARGDVSEA